MIHVALFGIDAGWGVLLTYLVHSTAWIVGALLLTRLHRVLSPAARHVVWRATLLGPLASSAFALGLDHGWQWAFTRANPASEAGATALAPQAALRPLDLTGPDELVRGAAGQAAPLREVEASLPWSTLLAGVWAFVALVAVLLIARAALRQRRAFEPRTTITDGPCVDALERLARRAGVRHHIRLSFSAAASTPLVLGAREICLPERAVELEPGALEAVFAHELAHIERRDSLWLNGALLLQALLWFQPLYRKARIELQESAELAADERAVELTGDPLGLARTLTHVASWITGTPLASSVAMARPGSAIVERVARLVESSEAPGGVRPRSRTPWFALAALAAVGACSPSVGAPQAKVPPAGLGSSTPDEPSARQPPAPALVPNSAAPVDASQPAPAPAPPRDAPEDHDARDGDEHHDPEPAAMPQLPIEGMVDDIVAGVVPRAIAFSSRIGQLATNEVQLELRIDAAQRAAAEPGASPEARDELARLQRELAASRQRRNELERDFEVRMDAWGKDFEQRFERDHAQRFAAWGEQFGRRMEAMAKGLERRLSQRQPPLIPPPPAPGIRPPRPPKVRPPTPPRQSVPDAP